LPSLIQPWTRRHNIAVAALVVVMLAVAYRAYTHRASAAVRPAAAAEVAVTSTRALGEKLPIYLTGIGNVAANYSVTVKVRVDGQLEKVLFREGQDVHENDILAQIDARPYVAQLEAAQAQQAKDEANLQNALVDLDRYTTLAANDSIAEQTLDTQRATVAQLRATVKVDIAQVDNAKVQLDYTTIRSPIAGRTGIRLVDPGNIVHATDTGGLVVVNQVDPISVIFTIPEDQFQLINQSINDSTGTALGVEAYAREDNTLLGSGHLLLVNNQIDQATGTVQLKATFANAIHRLWPGQYVNVHVITGVRDVVSVPSAAVQRGPDGLYAYVVGADNSASMQPVTVSLEQDGKDIITRGIAAGTRVVVDGQFRLKPGVKVVEAKAAAAAAAPKPSPDKNAAGAAKGS
jgi:membrane fusion protein, multidrug efflux system